ncbi:thiol:disulfide interchange protein DsbA/DsbL [Lysobacter sp. CW239]|uniref:thiol:disulfide interchange protein DsbA/DsbL n=1 Tax=Lysobacteraceae TaxID=32033 RepID=UPI00068AD866|nr:MULTISPECIES: thiol:disulfide interchange protein DsbA/DsbL [Lysobacter]QOD90910.1 thiol:disulfide interchange protein DsbA/DsbL [Lysobacter sp. CW239]
MTLRPASLFRLGLTLAAALALAACSSEAPTPAAPATTGAPAANAPADAAGTVAPPAPAAATATGSEAIVRTPGPIVPPTGPAPVAGSDYVEIAGGQPFQPNSGKIEVVEVFGYTCPACANFEPLVSAWAAKLPADVEFTPLAAPFGGFWMPYAKAFYTAQSTGLLAQSHEAMFKAIHLDRSLAHDANDQQIAQFYAQYGADPKQFASTMASFAINAKMSRAQQFLQRSGVDSTPTLVVDGKYRIINKSWEESLRVAEHLIAAERAAGVASAQPAGDGG